LGEQYEQYEQIPFYKALRANNTKNNTSILRTIP